MDDTNNCTDSTFWSQQHAHHPIVSFPWTIVFKKKLCLLFPCNITFFRCTSESCICHHFLPSLRLFMAAAFLLLFLFLNWVQVLALLEILQFRSPDASMQLPQIVSSRKYDTLVRLENMSVSALSILVWIWSVITGGGNTWEPWSLCKWQYLLLFWAWWSPDWSIFLQ